MRFTLIFLIAMSFLGLNLFAAPKANLWARWSKHNPDVQARIDHTQWDQLLSQYLTDDDPSGVNLVDYKGIKQNAQQQLNDYINALQKTRISEFNREEQFAFWVNLYNAYTVKLIVDHYPVISIRKITYGLFSFGPWDEKLIHVEGEKLSLNDIEHRILRPIWKDNRIHYAVNCASMGCPNLAAKAYTGQNYKELLDQGAREYVNHPRGAQFKDGELVVSSIYNWYQVDFGDSQSGVIEHLKQYAQPKLTAKLSDFQGRMDDQYDWELNEWKR